MFETAILNWEKLGYKVSCFKTKEDATAYIDSRIFGKSVGFGGSVTIAQMGLYNILSKHNTVYWHQGVKDKKQSQLIREKAAHADVYISSVNGAAESGEIINIDGNCNRISSILYGHEKVFLIIGKNKLAKDFAGALFRAKNIAAPKNAQRLGVKTPCAARADKCYDCRCPERICRSICILSAKPTSCEYEIICIEESLGY